MPRNRRISALESFHLTIPQDVELPNDEAWEKERKTALADFKTPSNSAFQARCACRNAKTGRRRFPHRYLMKYYVKCIGFIALWHCCSPAYLLVLLVQYRHGRITTNGSGTSEQPQNARDSPGTMSSCGSRDSLIVIKKPRIAIGVSART